MSTIGNNILLLRKQLGWSQEELAKRMGYKSKSTINKIELGKNDIPQSKIVQFAEVLGTTPAFLMGWSWSEEEKTTVADSDNSIGKSKKQLIDFAKNCTEEQAEQFLKVLEAMKDFLGEK